VKVDIGCFCRRVTAIGPWFESSDMMRRSGSNCRVAMLRAIYSASVVERVISDWSLLDYMMGHPQKVMMKPVRERTESRR